MLVRASSACGATFLGAQCYAGTLCTAELQQPVAIASHGKLFPTLSCCLQAQWRDQQCARNLLDYRGTSHCIPIWRYSHITTVFISPEKITKRAELFAGDSVWSTPGPIHLHLQPFQKVTWRTSRSIQRPRTSRMNTAALDHASHGCYNNTEGALPASKSLQRV